MWGWLCFRMLKLSRHAGKMVVSTSCQAQGATSSCIRQSPSGQHSRGCYQGSSCLGPAGPVSLLSSLADGGGMFVLILIPTYCLASGPWLVLISLMESGTWSTYLWFHDFSWSVVFLFVCLRWGFHPWTSAQDVIHRNQSSGSAFFLDFHLRTSFSLHWLSLFLPSPILPTLSSGP